MRRTIVRMLVGATCLAAFAGGKVAAQDVEEIPPAILDVKLQGELLSVEDAAEIAARIDRFKRLTVPVTIDGAGPYRFLVDTGSQATVVTHAVNDKMQLPSAGVGTVVATGSSEQVQLVRLEQIEFADREFYNLTSPLLEQRHVGADGIIGLDSLQDLRVLIDFREDTIRVVDSDYDVNPYEIVVKAKRQFGQMVITDARIDGVKVSVIIDTGAQGSLGNRALQRKLRAKLIERQVSTDVNGADVLADVSRERSLRFGPLRLSNIKIGYADSPVFKVMGMEDTPTLILGIGTMREFDRMAIDFSNRRIMFDLPSGLPRQNYTNSRINRMGASE